MKKEIRSGGGWPAIRYSLKKAREAGGFWKLYRALRSKNACKTCALGMGGQKGGMVNELGHFPEVCKKSLQAMVADMQGAISPDFFAKYSLPELRSLTPRELEACGRLTQPLLATGNEGHYRPLDWESALQHVADKFRQTDPQKSFWYVSGRSSNEAGFLLQLFVRMYGTNNINNCSYYCHQASGVGLNRVLGTGTATVTLEDVHHADLVFLIGGNPASNHPRFMRTLMEVRRNGGKVIVINPVVERGLVNFRVPSDVRSLFFGSEIASTYVQPHIGGDLALLWGIAKRVVELKATDEDFLATHCHGSGPLLQRLQKIPWEEIERKSGVDKPRIDEIAQQYAQSKKTVFAWTMGITHHEHGVQNVEAIAMLACLRGMVGRPHAGLLPIRGHSNVQGMGSMGVVPRLKETVLERLESHFGVELPRDTGMDTLACLEAADRGEFQASFCLGGNLYGASPDAAFTRDALGKLDLLVYVNTTLNTGHVHGLGRETLILPARARDEEAAPTTQESMFNFVRLSDGGPARHDGPEGELELISRLARHILGDEGPLKWENLSTPAQLREAIAQIVPGFEKLAEIERTKQEFHIPGRTIHVPTFPTADGRAQLPLHDLPELQEAGGQLRLMTVRSEGQFNTVVYEEEDLYRGQDRRDVVLMHPDDISRLGLSENEAVRIVSDTGQVGPVLVRPFPDVRTGNAVMYFPEANELVSRRVDQHSRTPAFKNILVRVEPYGPSEVPASPDLTVSASGPREPLRAC